MVRIDTAKEIKQMAIYGMTRVSTRKQNIERQVRNILALYPEAIIVREYYTGTTQERKEYQKVFKLAKAGDTLVFDSVSRMSRNAEEGYEDYENLYSRGINLVFLNEHHIDTDVYRKALETAIPMTGTNVDYILEGINKFLLELAKEQIKLAFDQSAKEVNDLHSRTKQGVETARLNGKQIGAVKGKKLTTKKSIEAKKVIAKHSIDFGGSLTDIEVMKMTGLAKNTYYKYKREMKSGE